MIAKKQSVRNRKNIELLEPPKYQNFSDLANIINNVRSFPAFRTFLASIFCVENIDFFVAVAHFKSAVELSLMKNRSRALSGTNKKSTLPKVSTMILTVNSGTKSDNTTNSTTPQMHTPSSSKIAVDMFDTGPLTNNLESVLSSSVILANSQQILPSVSSVAANDNSFVDDLEIDSGSSEEHSTILSPNYDDNKERETEVVIHDIHDKIPSYEISEVKIDDGTSPMIGTELVIKVSGEIFSRPLKKCGSLTAEHFYKSGSVVGCSSNYNIQQFRMTFVDKDPDIIDIELNKWAMFIYNKYIVTSSPSVSCAFVCVCYV